MKVTVVSIIIGALGTIPKGLVKGLKDLEIRGRAKTIQTTALLRSPRILRRPLETCGDLVSLKLLWKISANAGVKKRSKIQPLLLHSGWPRGVMVKALYCGIVESSNSNSAITFTFGRILLGKVWTSYPPSYGLNSTTTFLQEGWIWH